MWVGRKRTIDPGKANISPEMVSWHHNSVTSHWDHNDWHCTFADRRSRFKNTSCCAGFKKTKKKAGTKRRAEGIKKLEALVLGRLFVDSSGSQKTSILKRKVWTKMGTFLKIEHNPQWNWFNQVKYEPSSSR